MPVNAVVDPDRLRALEAEVDLATAKEEEANDRLAQARERTRQARHNLFFVEVDSDAAVAQLAAAEEGQKKAFSEASSARVRKGDAEERLAAVRKNMPGGTIEVQK